MHLSAALKDCIVMELDYTYNPLREELLREPINVHGGFLTPPEKPGLGVELNVGSVAKICLCWKRGACGQAENSRFGLVRATS